MKKTNFPIMFVFILCFALLSIFIMNGNINEVIPLDPNRTDAPSPTGAPININTATVREFMLLPGIGENLANRIVDYRNEHGPFQSVSDLQNVNGIGPDTYNEIASYISIGG